MHIDDLPKLKLSVLRDAGALGPGVKTQWAWLEVPDAPLVEVTGRGNHAFTIATLSSTLGNSGEVRVVVTKHKRGMICPRCGHGCYALVFRDGWGCRRCSGCPYRLWWHKYRTPMEKRRIILRQLARCDDPLSLRAYELECKLRRVNRALSRRAKSVEQRITSGRNR